MVGWHHRLNGHEFEQILGDGEGQEKLVCCSPWGCKGSDTTEWLNWTETITSSRGSSLTRNWTRASWFAGRFFTNWAIRKDNIYPYKDIHINIHSVISSVQFSRSVMSDPLQPHGLQHTRLPCPSPTPRAYSNSCPSSQWCHSTISSSVVPFSSCLQSFPASGSFPRSQFFTSGGQSIGISSLAWVLPMNIQDWFPSGLTCLISLQSKGLSRVFSNTTV